MIDPDPRKQLIKNLERVRMKMKRFCAITMMLLTWNAYNAYGYTLSDYFDDGGSNNNWEQVQGNAGDWYYGKANTSDQPNSNLWLYGKAPSEDQDSTALAVRGVSLSTIGLSIHSKFGMVSNQPSTGHQESGIFFGWSGPSDSESYYSVGIERLGFYKDGDRWYSKFLLSVGDENDDNVISYEFDSSSIFFDLSVSSYSNHFDVVLKTIAKDQPDTLVKEMSFATSGPRFGKAGVWTDEDGTLNLALYEISGSTTPPTAPVPEPTTMLLFSTGLIGLAAVGRRKNK